MSRPPACSQAAAVLLGLHLANHEPIPVRRSQFLGCPITYQRPAPAHRQASPSLPSRHYRNAALAGERLLDKEAERGIRNLDMPAEIARLATMFA
ncbi:hypothetical protein [Sinorhizobium psoraleae]|uniref:hypothetical protein n=1 Tax=Sinorhizobium psoraleae TaxID=520838 RepID=UPI001569A28F|nr:hypothetical protein [Sinorhizobium psoraleae]